MSTYQRILVPVDGSDSALLGVGEAIRLARDQAAKLRFVFVVDELQWASRWKVSSRSTTSSTR